MLRTVNSPVLRLSRPFHIPRVSSLPTRKLATTLRRLANRAVVYSSNGEPSSVLSTISYPDLPPPPPDGVNVEFLLSPINPADRNLVQGVYPVKKQTETLGHSSGVYVGGNEGLAIVKSVGEEAQQQFGLKEGDWVVMGKQQAGTWSSERCVGAQDVIKVPKDIGEVHGATITVNPPTAYNMLRDFVNLKEGDWVLQNGANSAVGEAVIQIAAHRGLRTINFVRNRTDIDGLKQHLQSLGGTHVFTYDDLSDKSTINHIKSLIGGSDPKLLLNCVSGKDTTSMLRLLGADATLVSYGAMSKQPLSVPTSYFIFKNLKTCGFWQSRWYNEHSREEREALMNAIVDIIRAGKLREPEHETVTIPGSTSDEEATQLVRETMRKVEDGAGRKVLLRVENVE
ncbi:NAD P-binding protein [Gloeophyllum trabeum ATCC 11539]|uniref:enoyl-[acyl-carrier-protein] reductase n=1 Tax=Gloeophyllum trabeum (strain ATCC 11539 / FP-39264 / Madison 617) TaxID=670483 RepID=S7RJY1_GLOTA|nr:NAD P-binding protein [Gloeophyllum trabeum ATCC 11539]EPQ52944.1 NAD P-binding protein [Gloeophyllum trabeum ATCC 11539]